MPQISQLGRFNGCDPKRQSSKGEELLKQRTILVLVDLSPLELDRTLERLSDPLEMMRVAGPLLARNGWEVISASFP